MHDGSFALLHSFSSTPITVILVMFLQVAAAGLALPSVRCVVHVDLPPNVTEYMQR